MTRSELEQIIAEEIEQYFLENSQLSPTNEQELDELSKGQSKKTGKYTSAGTVPQEQNRRVNVALRDRIGKKMMNLYARGNVRGTGKKKGTKSSEALAFRKSIQKKADSFVSRFKNINTDSLKPDQRQKYVRYKAAANKPKRAVINSFIWAAASQAAIKAAQKGSSAKSKKTALKKNSSASAGTKK